MVMVHGLMVAGLVIVLELARYWAARQSTRAERRGVSSNVVAAQAGYLARTTTKAPETRIYFTTHWSGAN